MTRRDICNFMSVSHIHNYDKNISSDNQIPSLLQNYTSNIYWAYFELLIKIYKTLF